MVYRHKEDTFIPRKNITVVDKINRHNRLVDDDLDAIIDSDNSMGK